MKAPAYLAINPTGAVPAIVDGDSVLTQNAAIMGYIADTYPEAGLAGDGSARQRGEAARWLAYVNSDVHPAFKPLFGPGNFIGEEAQYDAVKDAARKRVRAVFEIADRQLAGKPVDRRLPQLRRPVPLHHAALGRRPGHRPVRPGPPGRLQDAHGCRSRRAEGAEDRRPGLRRRRPAQAHTMPARRRRPMHPVRLARARGSGAPSPSRNPRPSPCPARC